MLMLFSLHQHFSHIYQIIRTSFTQVPMTKIYFTIFLISIIALAICTHLLLKISFSKHIFLSAFISIALILAIISTFYAYFRYSRIKYSNIEKGKHKN